MPSWHIRCANQGAAHAAARLPALPLSGVPAGLLCWQVEHFFAPEAALEEEERLRKEREERQAVEAAAADPPAEVRCS